MRVLGTSVISGTMDRALRGRLRVIAYHAVYDHDAFRCQLDMIADRYTTVGGAEVVAAFNGGRPLPDDAVWITFDDGDSSVVEHALPLLVERSMSATMFVCPGLVADGESHWWDVVESATTKGWVSDRLPAGHFVTALKRLPDVERRELVESAREHLESVDPEYRSRGHVANHVALDAWMSAGMELGNHTWDHPCLDQCDADEQRRQIVDADRWLEALGAFESCRLFAYPNGDWTSEAESALQDLGYDLALLFDHRLAVIDQTDPLRVSRVRLDTAVSVERARAVLSGGHSLLHRPPTPTESKAVQS